MVLQIYKKKDFRHVTIIEILQSCGWATSIWADFYKKLILVVFSYNIEYMYHQLSRKCVH